ncbi:hypothetical protein ACIRO3_26080 [Streptomyces sp. NPDC102278]|uniref:hypothetical protein n=1 Tax=Streptomyces sp. NPDC102278 TaxID=3366152 RepID=UPI003809A436
MSAAVLAAAAVTTAGPAVASTVSARLSCAHITAHFDRARRRTPENIALAPDGSADVTFAAARQLARTTAEGAARTLATLPPPADGGVHTPVPGFTLTTGIVRAHDGALHFLYATGTGTPDLTCLWRLRPGGEPQRTAALPAAGLPDGLALDPRTHTRYATDSVLGTIVNVPTTGGTPASATAPCATNLARGTVLRHPHPVGRARGRGSDSGHGMAGTGRPP